MVLAAWWRAPSPQSSPTRRRRAGEGRNLWVDSWVAGETRARRSRRGRPLQKIDGLCAGYVSRPHVCAIVLF